MLSCRRFGAAGRSAREIRMLRHSDDDVNVGKHLKFTHLWGWMTAQELHCGGNELPLPDCNSAMVHERGGS